MTGEELELLLNTRVNEFNLKKAAFEILDSILLENSDNKNFLNGFEKEDIKIIFEGFEYSIGRRFGNSVIRTKIGLYIESEIWLENLEPIGYYELETDLNGEIVDDWFVIEKEKYLKDIEIISHFQSMNEKLPVKYLRRNHIQYEFVTYISMIGTLFISKNFEGAGRFILRAYKNLIEVDESNFDKDYLKNTIKFLKMMSKYLISNNLLTEELDQKLIENKFD